MFFVVKKPENALGIFDVERFLSPGSNEDATTIQLQRAASEACAFSAAYENGATLRFPFRKLRVADTITISGSNVVVDSVGTPGNDLFEPYGACLVPVPDFPNDQYVLAFDWAANNRTRSLYNCRMRHIAIMKQNGETLANTVHGVYWGVDKGVMEDCCVDSLTGRALGIQGHSSDFKASDSHFLNSRLRRCANGVEFLGSSADNWFFAMKIEGCVTGAGILNPGAQNQYEACHLTGNLNNVKFTSGSSEVTFLGGVMETPREHNVDINVTGGGVTSLAFNGVLFNSNALTANDTFHTIHIHRDSGSNTATVSIGGPCRFKSDGTNKPLSHVNLTAAAEDCIVGSENIYSNIATPIIHNANAERCIVHGLGRNAGNPNSTGHWFGKGRHGVDVEDTQGNAVYKYSALTSTWYQISN